MSKDLTADPARFGNYGETGIYVRAKGVNGVWDSFDIVDLDRESLLSFIRSRGENSAWCESIILILLGHRGGEKL